ncbi:WYL domain-containing protein [Leifsonia poae]|uniref:WYL domain-containing protein n=1 Tax=Leifsonia poae TaxID=110933 RepID=UPI001CBB1000
MSLLGELARSCLLRRRVAFLHTHRDGQSKERRVDPHALVNTVQRWYLVAFDRLVRERRRSGLQTTLWSVRAPERQPPSPHEASMLVKWLGLVLDDQTLPTIAHPTEPDPAATLGHSSHCLGLGWLRSSSFETRSRGRFDCVSPG